MKLRITLSIALCIIGLAAPLQFFARERPSAGIAAPHRPMSTLAWKRVNPDGWFSFVVPQPGVSYVRAVDSYAGTYWTHGLEINYIYWQIGGRPNFLRDFEEGAYTGSCEPSSRHFIRRASKTSGRLVQLRMCGVKDEKRPGMLAIEVYAPRTRVFDAGQPFTGEFYFTVYYSNAKQREQAWRVVRSLRFTQ